MDGWERERDKHVGMEHTERHGSSEGPLASCSRGVGSYTGYPHEIRVLPHSLHASD